MKKIKISAFLIMVFFICTNLFSKTRVAVLDFSAKGIDEIIAEAVTENLITSLIDSGTYEVIERSQLNKLMSELKLQNSDDFNDQLRHELGNLFGVKLVILGSVTKIGEIITINVRGVEVDTGIAKFAKNVKSSTENNIAFIIPLLVDIISGKKIDEDTLKDDEIEIKEIYDDKEFEEELKELEKKTDELKTSNELKSKLSEGKVLIVEYIVVDDWESETFYIDELENLDNFNFSKIILTVDKNCVEIGKFKLYFDDLEDDVSESDNFELNNKNPLKEYATTNKKGEPRKLEKIKIRAINRECNEDSDAVIRIYGIR